MCERSGDIKARRFKQRPERGSRAFFCDLEKKRVGLPRLEAKVKGNKLIVRGCFFKVRNSNSIGR